MKIFLYILRDYLKFVIGIVFLCTFLFILFDFIHKSTRYLSKYEPTAVQMAQLYFYQLPSTLIQTLPIASLLGSVITMILLSRHNEVTAMRAVGMSPARIGMPLGFGGLLISVVSLILGEAILPKFAENMYYLKEVVIEQQSATELAEGARWVRQDHLMFSFKDYNPSTRKMNGLQIIELGESFLPVQLSYAKTAEYLDAEQSWHLTDIDILMLSDQGRLQQKSQVASMMMQLPVNPAKLRKERRPPSELGAGELSELIKRRREAGLNAIDFEVDLHFKLSFAFSAFVVSLIGLQFGYRSERTTETVKGVLLAFGVGICYWFILTACRTLCTQSGLPPILGAWIPNVTIMGFSLVQNLVIKSRS